MAASLPNTSLTAWVEEVGRYDRALARRIGGETLNPYAVAAELRSSTPTLFIA